MPGPVPKRSDQRRRRNKQDVETQSVLRTGDVRIPSPAEDWHPIAVEWFDSLKDSAVSQYYDTSDWATAKYVAEAMSRNLQGGRFSGQLFAAVMSAMTDLLTTEGARRRARLEIERNNGIEETEATSNVVDLRNRALGNTRKPS